MQIYSPIAVIVRLIIYSSFIYGISEAIYFDAAFPMEDGYFGELTLTEIGQELFLFILFWSFLNLGRKWKEVRPVSNLAALFFLASFFREFNFILNLWVYPVVITLLWALWLIIRDFKKIRHAALLFFSAPPSGWLLSGFLALFIFSRLMGRSKFWRLLYSEEHYRLAKAATEEGIELFGNALFIIAAIEYYIYVRTLSKTSEK